MKKGFKKEIELELIEVMTKTLEKHNIHALDKSKKAIKKAGKSVAKKFTKTLKALDKARPSAKRQNATALTSSRKVVKRKATRPQAIKHAHSLNGKTKHDNIATVNK